MLLSGDHPSLGDFPAATSISLVDNVGLQSSIGQAGGTIGTAGDDDMFMFVAPYSGRTAITVIQNHVGGLAPAIQLFDADGNPQGDLSDGHNGVAAVPPIPLDTIEQGHTYYINVRAGTPSDTNEPNITGDYTVVIVMEIPPQDSTQPPEQNTPVRFPLDVVTGQGTQYGFIIDGSDTDRYYFDTLGDGEVSINLTTPASDLQARMDITDADGNPVASGLSDETSLLAFYSLANRRYFVNIHAFNEAAPWSDYGAYTLSITAAVPGTPEEPPADDHLTDSEIAAAVPIGIDLATGLAHVSGSITSTQDSDVFTFHALRSGSATVAIDRTDGEAFGAVLDVFRDPTTRVAFDPVGTPAWVAHVTFDVVQGSDYYIRVRGSHGSIGAYSLQALSPLTEYVLTYPEGYSSSTIDEFVPLVNPNAFPVTYTITARYEVGDRDQVIASGVIPASSRGGVTITSRQSPGTSLVRTDTPYALEIRSSGEIGATLSHYDFGVTTGENFTCVRSTEWTFAEARRDPAQFRDFLVFYNPNESATAVRISLVYDDGTVVSFNRQLDALRRGGVNFTTDTSVTHSGVFSIRVESDQPIVAALSSYDYVLQRGFGLLGAPDNGSTRGAIPIFAGAPGARPTVGVFNSSGIAATVTFTTTLVGQSGTVEHQFTIGPGQRRTLTSSDLGLNIDVLAALRYSSDVPVTVASSEYHTGDGDATLAAENAVESSVVADAFVNPAGAGTTYQELLSIYNPWGTPTQVRVRLLSEGAVLDTLDVTVGTQGFSFVRVDQMPGVLAHDGPVAFSVRIDGHAPVVASFMHYDLYLDGGWGTLAAPLGLVTPLAFS